MRNLTLDDLNLALSNLMTQRKTALDSTASGLLYGPMLAEKLTAITALPEILHSGKPLADELAAVDDDHDGFGGAIFAYTEAVLDAPSMTDAHRAAALRIRESFIPSKSALIESYAEEAATAKRNRGRLAERKDDLELFPVPGGKTLFDWATSFVDKGNELDTLLHQRSLANMAQSDKASAIRLRSDTLGLAYQFRGALRAEIMHKKLSPELDGQVFSYFDELSARRPGKKPAKTV